MQRGRRKPASADHLDAICRCRGCQEAPQHWRIRREFGYGVGLADDESVEPQFPVERGSPMIDLKRILTATDFSDASQVALRYAVAFSQAFQAEVLLCHVLEKPDLLSGLPPVAEGYFPPNLAELQE